jgi:tRNA(His) 5'-end guanylyltransferase
MVGNLEGFPRLLALKNPLTKDLQNVWSNAGRVLFEKGFSPALIYVVSDELDILFLDNVPYSGRVEKIGSVIPSFVSATFTLRLQKTFGKTDNVAFDSRVVIVPSENAVMNYLAWRQTNAWRNHNNAYVYWLFRKMGYKPIEAAKN